MKVQSVVAISERKIHKEENRRHKKMEPKEKILQANGFVALKRIEILGKEYLIDELLEEEELNRIYTELGLVDSDDEDDLEAEMERPFHIEDNDDDDEENEEGG